MVTVKDVVEITGGRAINVDPSTRISGFVTDSRAELAGKAFIALRGEVFDGHEFALSAVASGAPVAIVEQDIDGPAIVVSSTLKAYADIAASHLTRLRSVNPALVVVAVTGSSGKTSTKDLLAHVLAPLGEVVAPLGSFNNEVGLPATVLSAQESTRVLVLEMGMRGLGHIAYLCRIAAPDIPVVLNVGSAHMGEVGSREGIAAAKSEIIEHAAPSAVSVLNMDDPLVRAMAAQAHGPIRYFGETEGADLLIEDVRLDDKSRASFSITYAGASAHVDLQLHGEHHVHNAAAAALAAVTAGVDLQTVAVQLSTATPRSKWRMEVLETSDGVTVINDAYNANPESMRAALKSLVGMSRGRKTWAVLGEMRELGAASVEEHDAIGRLAVRLDVSKLISVGSGARPIHMGAAHEGSWGDESVYVETVDEAIAMVRDEVQPGDVILVKASRSIGLERVAASLLDERGTVEIS